MQPEMKYIYTVYQCGSFSKAAEKLSAPLILNEPPNGVRLFAHSEQKRSLFPITSPHTGQRVG